MKKLNIISLLSIMFFGLIVLLPVKDVNAAYAYVWNVGGETLSKGSSNKSGTATWADDTLYNGGVLTLNNYQGGPIKIECKGTALGHVFAIKLVGQNKISAKDGIGIYAGADIAFIGDGQLVIEAKTPIGGEHHDNVVVIEPKNCSVNCPNCPACPVIKEETTNDDNNETITENTDNEVNNEEVSNDNEKEETEKNENANNEDKMYTTIGVVAACIYFVISIALIIFLSAKLSSLIKAKKN